MVLVRMSNGTAAIKNFKKLKHRIAIQPSNSTPKYTPKRSENRDSDMYLHARLHRGVARSGPQAGTTQADH